ncbi:beta-glucosidase E [Penicillium argentinense]|uniref:Probable beta-glucosidase E n=1 Tax=Penicillium argentinense TaxID=1131581 RepID=A0A9W9G0Y9_9EURO|nr:beta-glucosidase E [Penicillium argentinense]KAJ5110001.1 beta-glucosidase E [Penicillium argentinense]
MARSRAKADARRGKYESLDSEIPDEATDTPASPEYSSGANANANTVRPPPNTEKDLPHPDDLDLLSSGDELENVTSADVKLLPLPPHDTRKGPVRGRYAHGHGSVRFETPGESSSSSREPSQSEGDAVPVPTEQRDVGKRIEKFLETERRNVLAEAFRTDIEDANTDFVLSDEEDDYGVPLKDEPKWMSRWRAVFGQRSWWHILFFAVAAIMAMWLAMKGLVWIRGERNVEGNYHSVPWYPTPLGGTSPAWRESYQKAKGMVERMSLIEKVGVTTGTGWEMGLCVGNTEAAASVGFPSLCLQDGPLGLRFADNITAFPAGITTGATWNRALMRARGSSLGREARAKGVNVLLGPSIGAMGLMPAGGRNWESFGSDPVLQAVAAAETIQGIQHIGVMATAKHFVLNEQEHFRQPNEGSAYAVSSNIDDRALHEVFVWPFAESIRADVASVMCAYQRVNSSYSCENSKLLNGILKDELGFQGFVQSDWLAQRSGVQSALSGLDMSMPGDGLGWADGKALWGPQMTAAALNTSVPMDRLNDMVTRIVASWFHFRQDLWEGGPNFSSWTNETMGRLHPGSPDDDSWEAVNHFVNARKSPGSKLHSDVARQVAAEGTVLLKNVNSTLPLSRKVSSPNGKYRIGIYGEDAGPGNGPNACADRGCNQGTLASGWGSGAVDFPYLVSPWEALKFAWPADKVEVKDYLTNNVAYENLLEQDLCIVFVNSDGGEGFIHSDDINGDRNDLFLQRNGTELVDGVARHCGGGRGRTVVVVHSVGPVVLEPWIDLPGVHAVLYANLPGQESGHALVDVLFGDVDASGRLPYTIGRSLEDYGPGAQILYETDDRAPQMDLSQGLYMDYRYFDRHNITPRYEFGYGLSYTTFEFADLRINPLQEKSRLPHSRVDSDIDPPSYPRRRERAEDCLFPKDLKVLSKYIYPYLRDTSGTEKGEYPYPDGYDTKQKPSEAGGGLGGNPSLWEAMLELSVKVTNTGKRAGKEVVQIYVSFPDEVVEHRGISWTREKIDFPVRVLRNFEKVTLEAGESTVVNMTLSRKDLSYWSVRAQNWVLPTDGAFKIWAGRSSRDLPLVADY